MGHPLPPASGALGGVVLEPDKACAFQRGRSRARRNQSPWRKTLRTGGVQGDEGKGVAGGGAVRMGGRRRGLQEDFRVVGRSETKSAKDFLLFLVGLSPSKIAGN